MKLGSRASLNTVGVFLFQLVCVLPWKNIAIVFFPLEAKEDGGMGCLGQFD